jgi:hypothetical protein
MQGYQWDVGTGGSRASKRAWALGRRRSPCAWPWSGAATPGMHEDGDEEIAMQVALALQTQYWRRFRRRQPPAILRCWPLPSSFRCGILFLNAWLRVSATRRLSSFPSLGGLAPISGFFAARCCLLTSARAHHDCHSNDESNPLHAKNCTNAILAMLVGSTGRIPLASVHSFRG